MHKVITAGHVAEDASSQALKAQCRHVGATEATHLQRLLEWQAHIMQLASTKLSRGSFDVNNVAGILMHKVLWGGPLTWHGL